MYRMLMMIMVGCVLISHLPMNQKLLPTYTNTYVMEVMVEAEEEVIEVEPEFVMETTVTDAEYDLLADIVMAEAENQTWDAQYAVACVVLNRVKSELFPDTIHDVVYQTKPAVQFSPTADGRLKKVSGTANESVLEAIESALLYNDFPDDVLYFTSIGYLSNTIPYKKIDDLAFSRQK